VLLEAYKSAGHPGAPQIEDIMESGQKELRIIDTLEPVMGRHKLIVNEQVWRDDIRSTQKYAMDHRTVYTLWHQMTKISRDKGALIHDDRLDSLAGAVRPWVDRIAVDENARMAQKHTDASVKFMADWVAHGSQEQMVAENIATRSRAGIVQNKALHTNRRNRR
jgi:hypothetical protein